MSAIQRILERLRPAQPALANARSQDPAAAQASNGTLSPEPAGAVGSDPVPDGSSLDEGVVAAVAQKVLYAAIRNRHQRFFPFVIDRERIEDRTLLLLAHAAIAACRADGTRDALSIAAAEQALAPIVPETDERARLIQTALDEPMPLATVLASLPDYSGRALAYAVSLLALDRRNFVNRRYLSYLAARLQLAHDLVTSLEHRYRSGR